MSETSVTTSLGFPVYDADQHLYEPEELLTTRLPEKWRKEVQFVEVRGRKKLAVGGVISEFIPNPAFEVVAAPGSHEPYFRANNPKGLSLREMAEIIPCEPAFRNGQDRLKRLNELGVHASLIFPTLACAFESRMSYNHELLSDVLHTLNEWMAEDFGFHTEERLFAVPFISLMDQDWAIRELEWCLKRGARAVALRPGPVPGYRASRSFGFEEFDPFWARVNEAGIFIAMHGQDTGYDALAQMWLGTGEFSPFRRNPFSECLNAGRAISDSMAAFICHGVFDRHPNVRVAAIETGTKWVRPLIEMLERIYRQMPQEFRRHPVEAFREHIYVSPFYEDPVPEVANLIGATNIIFGSDYPHPEGLARPLDFVRDIEDFGLEDRERMMSSNLKALLEGRAVA